MGAKYGKSLAQVMLRWNLQKGVVTIPKSAKKSGLLANADIFDFALSNEDMAYLDGLEKSKRFGPDPDTFDF